ncbi:TPA: type IV pilus biogenesis protein PilI [Salmonella enterica subsp. enterica serovar Schwarzengrund]
MGSCAAPSAKGDDKFITTDYLQQCRLFSTKTPTDPDELARRFCTPDNCLVVVLRDNRFLFRLERAPGSHCRWHKGSSSRHQHLQDWLS